MNILVVFSAICIGLAAGGASHARHAGSDFIGSGTQQRELVDVPYTVEYKNLGEGSYKSSGGNSFGRNYQQQPQPQPQFEIQRSQPIHQSSYSYSQPQQQPQTRQYVDVPYTVEVRKSAPVARTYSQPQVQAATIVRQRSYVQPQQQIVEVPYQAPVVQQRTYAAPKQAIHAQPQQYVDIPYTVEIQRAPVVQKQRSYSPPAQTIRRQSKQLVDVPYTIETIKNSNADSGLQFLPYSAGNSLQIQAPQQIPSGRQQQLVDVPYQVIGGGASTSASDNFRFLPYSLGDSLQISSIGGGVSGGYGSPLGSHAIY